MPDVYIQSPSLISSNIAQLVVDTINFALTKKSHCVLVPSAGRTHIGTWANLRNNYRDATDWSKVICIQMDEYHNVSCSSPDSFATQIYSELVNPLKIGRFLTFQDTSGNMKCTPLEYERQLIDLGGADCVVHGVGRNSHIGFNEPSQDYKIFETRVVQLSEDTKSANQVSYSHGVTLGIRALLGASTSIVAITGMKKQSAAASLLLHPICPEFPVSYLRLADGVRIFLDPESIGSTLQQALDSNEFAGGINLIA